MIITASEITKLIPQRKVLLLQYSHIKQFMFSFLTLHTEQAAIKTVS